MEHPKVRRLYKYAAFNARSISALVTGKLWFASAYTFNDPFDCALVDNSQVLTAERERHAQKLLLQHPSTKSRDRVERDINAALGKVSRKFFNHVVERDKALLEPFSEIHKQLQSLLYKFGVLSLSATARSVLMWSHYGGQHTGMCFEFERSIENSLGKDAMPVKYSSARIGKMSPDIDPPQNPLFAKYNGWRYEREWRLLAKPCNQLHDFPGELKAIVCGARMSQPDIDALTKIVESLNLGRPDPIKLRFAKMDSQKYQIKIGAVRQRTVESAAVVE